MTYSFHNEERDLLTAYEVSHYLRIPLNSVYYLTRIRKIPALKVGKHLRYQKSRIESFYSDITSDSLRLKSKVPDEKRKMPRLNTHIEVRVVNLLNNDTEKAFVFNLSSHGAAIALCEESSLRINDPLSMNFSIERDGHKQIHIETHARVSRLSAEKSGAVIFRHMDTKMKKSISTYIG
jgi:excisionase family DNA binding protein